MTSFLQTKQPHSLFKHFLHGNSFSRPSFYICHFPPILTSRSSLYVKQFYTREEETDIFTVSTSGLNKLTPAWVVSCLFWSTPTSSLLLILYVANLLFTVSNHTELCCMYYIYLRVRSLALWNPKPFLTHLNRSHFPLISKTKL